ncbi:MAG: DUF2845 domain-containing protein [Gammaproteobacteria bacterium]|nr:MAG: DUF2845 domain-containing protein [Gammaproteobacteria bacterium]
MRRGRPGAYRARYHAPDELLCARVAFCDVGYRAGPAGSGHATGGAHQVGTSETQIWRYDRGPRQFPAVMKIADGVVQSIEFEKNPGSPRD